MSLATKHAGCETCRVVFLGPIEDEACALVGQLEPRHEVTRAGSVAEAIVALDAHAEQAQVVVAAMELDPESTAVLARRAGVVILGDEAARADRAVGLGREGLTGPALALAIHSALGQWQILRLEIEKRLRAEAEARSAHEFVEAVLWSMPVGVVMVERAGGRPIFANERFRVVHDLPAEGFEREHMERAIATLSRSDGSPYPVAELPLWRTLADGQAHESSDIWCTGASGLTNPHTSRAAVLPVPYKGREVAILVVQDIAALREQQRQRRVAEQRYQAIVAQAPDGVLVATATDAEIVEANRTAERLLGRRADALLGTSAKCLFAPTPGDGRSSESVFEEQIAVARRDGVARFTARVPAPAGGSLELQVMLQPLRLERSPELLIVRFRDVTEERVLNEKLHQSQKLEAIGMLASGVAHDFNNVLNGVTGFLELAHDRLPENGEKKITEARKFVAEAGVAANRAVELTRQLLALGRRSSSNRKALDLNESVRRTLTLVRRLIGETIELEMDLDPQGCPIQGDTAEIEQALMNLATNAREAMPRGGRLRISTRRHAPTPIEAGAVDLAPGDHIVLEVNDTGCGIPDSVKARLFEPSFTTKNPGPGRGLGLAVVHRVVQRHGGGIDVDSAVGKGTRFTIRLPLAPGAETPRPLNSQPSALRRGTGSVLVVDDDPIVREVTAAMLETLGYRVAKVASAAEALEHVAREVPDLVVSDVVMPEVSGVDLERRLRAEHAGVPVLLVSGCVRDAFTRHGIEVVPANFLSKPLTLASLGNKVQELLAPGLCRGGSAP